MGYITYSLRMQQIIFMELGSSTYPTQNGNSRRQKIQGLLIPGHGIALRFDGGKQQR